MSDFSGELLQSVKKSYLNILALFFEEEKIDTRYLRCLLKWGFQLGITPDDLKPSIDLSQLRYTHPEEKLERLESIYHLVT